MGTWVNVLKSHLHLVIPVSYLCHYTNLCPDLSQKRAHTLTLSLSHTHTHTHTHTYSLTLSLSLTHTHTHTHTHTRAHTHTHTIFKTETFDQFSCIKHKITFSLYPLQSNDWCEVNKKETHTENVLYVPATSDCEKLCVSQCPSQTQTNTLCSFRSSAG